MIKKRIKIPIYLGYLIIIVTKRLKKIVRKYNVISTTDLDSDAFSFRLVNKKRVVKYYCVLRPKTKPGVIAHEANHLVNMIFKDDCIMLDTLNDEAQSYFLQWIVKQIDKTIKK